LIFSWPFSLLNEISDGKNNEKRIAQNAPQRAES
jgi:hypothetical protein